MLSALGDQPERERVEGEKERERDNDINFVNVLDNFSSPFQRCLLMLHSAAVVASPVISPSQIDSAYIQ